MFRWLKFRKLSDAMRQRVLAFRPILANTLLVPTSLYGKEYYMECVVIPAMTPEGEKKTARFVFPGGGTDLFLPTDPHFYSDRRTIVVSPFGYGRSSDLPDEIYEDFLHCAPANLQVIRALGEKKVILSLHSNANPTGYKMVSMAREFGVEIEKVESANPLGLRHIPIPLALLAFGISGLFTRVMSLFVEQPVDLLRGTYYAPKHKRSGAKIRYELGRSSAASMLSLFREIKEKGVKIPPILLVLTTWNWASMHLPWRPSDEEIFREFFPGNLLEIKKIRGAHNPTLGWNAERLAEITERSFEKYIPMVLMFLPQVPVCVEWMARGLGVAA